MIINCENLNTVANITSLGLVTALLGYNEDSYEINKKNYEINKKMLEINNNEKLMKLIEDICFSINGIKKDLDIIIERMGCDKDGSNR